MRHILCFGDSNTYGYNGANGTRFDDETRWTRLLQKKLGDAYLVLEEGLNSRTTVFEDPLAPGKNGLQYVVPCVCSHLPIDLMIVMLGTNDLKPMFSVGSTESSEGLGRVLRTIQNTALEKTGAPLKVLVVSPILIQKAQDGQYYYSFNERSEAESQKMATAYRQIAEQMGASFLDAAQIASPDSADGIHLDAKGHAALADAFADYILKAGI